ncbi:MAG: hypothetical protein ABSA01_06410 [Anaerolineales bacterium]
MSLHNINLALKRQQSNRFMMVMDIKIRIKPLFISRKVETMLATTLKDKKHSLEISQEPRWNTYIPSPFFLLLAIENGWKIARIMLFPSEDQHSLVYVFTLNSESSQPDQKVILPSNALVKKILAENSQMAVPVMAEALN